MTLQQGEAPRISVIVTCYNQAPYLRRAVASVFGQTETSPAVTQSKTTDSLEVRVSTVGSVLPGLEIRLVDPDTVHLFDKNSGQHL